MKLKLFISSLIFGVAGGVGVFIANIYWINFGDPGEYAQYLPEGIWEEVFPIMLQGVVLEALFLAAFIVPVLKIGNQALVAYMIVNFLTASFATFVFATMVDPMQYAGWGYMSLILVAPAPVILGIILGIQAFRNSRRNQALSA